MRKQNSTFQTAFISEAGSELGNNDYFAFVELEKYACYVIADGLNELPNSESAKLATQTVILAFQEHPSMRKSVILSYLKEADKALCKADSRERLKASVTVIVTDYTRFRYGYAGNTRLRFYRDGLIKEQTQDMSLGYDIGREKNLAEDVLAKHEERNNLYSYIGQGIGLSPVISKKIKLVNGDILTLYTRGIWENIDSGEINDVFSEAKDEPRESLDNIEDLLLSRQPEELGNYTFAAIFVNKVFVNPNRKQTIKRILAICIPVLILALTIGITLWILHRQKQKNIEQLNLKYSNAIEYIQDNNYMRAEEECREAIKEAEKLKDKKRIKELSDYLKLIEAVNSADEAYSNGKYEEARDSYEAAKNRSRYADRLADDYIDKQLGKLTDYMSVFDYIKLGDTLTEQGDFNRAEDKYLRAKQLATEVYFEEGRKEALAALEAMYTSRDKAEEAGTQEAKDKAISETGAANLTAEGDKAFAQGDYEGAKAYYAMAVEKYQELDDESHAQLIQGKMDSCNSKSNENKSKENQAEKHLAAAQEQQAAGEYLEAKKQYMFAKNIYKNLKLDDKVIEVEGLIEILDMDIEKDRIQKEEEKEKEKEAESIKKEESEEEVSNSNIDSVIGPGVGLDIS